MTDRVTTLLAGRRERLERLLGRTLSNPDAGSQGPASPKVRAFLLDEAEDLYWNELEWERLTDEEKVDGVPLPELTFSGLLAFVRGLLMRDVMPDALAPANPRPEVVEDLLRFLADRVRTLKSGSGEPSDQEDARLTEALVDLVLYQFHGLSKEEVARVESAIRPE